MSDTTPERPDVEAPATSEDELTGEDTQEHDTATAAASDDDTVNADEVEVESDDDRATNVEGDVNVTVTGQDTGGE